MEFSFRTNRIVVLICFELLNSPCKLLNCSNQSISNMGCLEDENQNQIVDHQQVVEYIEPSAFKRPLKWSNIILLSVLHISLIIFYVYVSLYPSKTRTVMFSVLLGYLSGIASSAGGHRLWAHRAFKASNSVKIFFVIFQCITMNGSALSYARDHRLHHKCSDTDGDPKNPSRGLFYSHIGWWLVKKTKTVIRSGRKLDYTDLYNDYWLHFQHRFYVPLFILFGMILPTIIPVYFWNEDPVRAFGSCVVIRICVVLHSVFTINSLAHHVGYRPYDFRIRPTDHRLVNYLSLGEGLHNFHHVFPYDYRINDRPQWELFTPTVAFVHLFHYFGLISDLKTASPAVVEETIRKRGVKALFDEQRSLGWRIGNAILDWTFGCLVSTWLLYPAILFVIWTNRPIVF